jgi:hypothetical protein
MPSITRAPSSLRFVTWDVERSAVDPARALDLRLTSVDILRQAAALAQCIDDASVTRPVHQPWVIVLRQGEAGRSEVAVSLVGDASLPELTGCFSRALAGAPLLDEVGIALPYDAQAAWRVNIGLLVNPEDDPSLPSSGPPDRRERVRLAPDGRCYRRVEPPCAPHKSCMAPYETELQCPSDAGLPAPTAAAGSELTLVVDERTAGVTHRRAVVTRWNELCAVEVRAATEHAAAATTSTRPEAQPASPTLYPVRRGPIPCRALDELASLARQVNDAHRRAKRGPARDTASRDTPDAARPSDDERASIDAALRLNRLEPSWRSVRVLVDLDAIADPPPSAWLELRAAVDALVDRWTLPVPPPSSVD